MKYIKYFEGFGHSYFDKEVEDNMNDYMLPLRDKGFIVGIFAQSGVGYEVNISRYGINDFEFSEVSDEVSGLINFMKHNYEIDIDEINISNSGRNDITFGLVRIINNLSDVKDDEIINHICLFFKKD